MEIHGNAHLTFADTIVLRSLAEDIDEKTDLYVKKADAFKDQAAMEALLKISDEDSDEFQSSPFSSWDESDLNIWVRVVIVQPYVTWTECIVRRRADVVFITHLGYYCATMIPSAFYLYYRFSWLHGACHWLLATYYAGPFTLLLHNHIHNNGIMVLKYAWFDRAFPYLLGPLLGHTPNSYYYHHVRHHHVEENGPGDLSSTIRYQRDDIFDFLSYLIRFLTLVWIELPLYFLRRHEYTLAFKSFLSEASSMTAIYWMTKYDFRPTLFIFLLPVMQMRIFMMIGNWGQHAFVDEIEPNSKFRSSITLIDSQVSPCCNNPVVVLIPVTEQSPLFQ